MKILKNILSVFVLLAVLSIPGVSFAQNNLIKGVYDSDFPEELGDDYTVDYFEDDPNQPDVYVSDVVIDKNVYATGGTVIGSFKLNNVRESGVDGIYYNISLVGDYDESGIATSLHDTKRLGPVSLNGLENKTINFEYKIPFGIGGEKLAIDVEASLNSGVGLGWSESGLINITGGRKVLTFYDTGVLTSLDELFATDEGITIYQDEEPKSAKLIYDIENDTNVSVELTPVFDIYSRFSNSEIIETVKGDSFAVSANSTHSSTGFSIPTMDYKSGVYFGEYYLVDSDGYQRTQKIGIRWIVGGDIATINSVVSNVKDVKQGDFINLSINYSGTPFDISTADDKEVAQRDAKLNVEVLNENDEVIGREDVVIDLNTDNKEVGLSIVALNSAKSLKARISIEKDGQVLDTFESSLLGGAEVIPDGLDMRTILYIVGGIILVILVLILVFNDGTNGKSIPTVILLLAVLSGMGIVADTPSASSLTIYKSWSSKAPFCDRWYYPPSVKVSSPTLSQEYQCGDVVEVRGDTKFHSCLNTPQRVTAFAGLAESSADPVFSQSTILYKASAKGAHAAHRNLTKRFALDLVIPGDAEGAHNVWVKVTNKNGCEAGGRIVYQPINVSCDAPVDDVCPDNPDYPETLGNQESVPAGFKLEGGQCIPLGEDPDADSDDDSSGGGSGFGAECLPPFTTTGPSYTWEGRGFGGSGRYSVSWSSARTQTFAIPGLYTNTLTVEDLDSGRTATKSCPVYYGSDNSGLPDISEVGLDNPLTNDVCIASFKATNSRYCDCIDLDRKEAVRFFDEDTPVGVLPTTGNYNGQIYDISKWTGQTLNDYLDSVKGVPEELGGSYEVDPGRYVIQCFNEDGVPAVGNQFQCILNPDIREQ